MNIQAAAFETCYRDSITSLRSFIQSRAIHGKEAPTGNLEQLLAAFLSRSLIKASKGRQTNWP
jgi:hypothetical protein